MMFTNLIFALFALNLFSAIAGFVMIFKDYKSYKKLVRKYRMN